MIDDCRLPNAGDDMLTETPRPHEAPGPAIINRQSSIGNRRRVAILANPRAGAGQSRRHVETFARRLHALGLAPVVCWHRRELSDVFASGKDDLRCVVAAGGDGTVLEVLNRAPGVPVAVLPLGTENLVACYCGVTRSARTLAEVIAAGKLRQFDVARANGRVFCLMASAGFDAAVVHRVHRRRRGHITRLSYGLPVVQLLQDYRYPPIDVEVMDTGEKLRGSLAFVFNVPRYGLGLPIAPDARPDDGLLDLYVFERPGALALARYGLAVLRGRQGRLPDVHHRQARGFRLSSAEPVPLQTDGDPAGWLPATVEVVPRALTLMVPGVG
jgi:diacylglycerol kinase family enzyme